MGGKMLGYKSLLNLVLILGTVSGRNTRSTAATTETTTTAVADTDGYGPTIAALTSISSVETGSNCGSDAEGYYEEYVTDEYRYVIVSGAPSHEAEYDQTKPNPNVRCERWQYVKLPLTWTDSGSTTQEMGAV